VRRFIRERDLLRHGDRLLVALSGGPDSTCLLLVLAALRRSLGIELTAAYFDHRLRGPTASAREERFARELAGRLAVPVVVGAGDVRAHAKAGGLSIEQAARELRYRFLAQAAHAADCGAVATGHTKDDQAETVLLHVVRGSGLAGLAGMAPSAGWPVAVEEGTPAPRLVRPLLALSRADSEACCREAGIEPLQDPSNQSRAHLRNRVRHELLPLLRQYNPRVDDALVRLAGSAAQDDAFIEAQARAALTSIARATPEGQTLSRSGLHALPPALQSRAIRLALAELGVTPSERQLLAVLRAGGGAAGAQLDLPRGLRVEVQHDELLLSTGREAHWALPDGQVELPVPGWTAFGPWRLRAGLIDVEGEAPPAEPLVAWLDAEAAGGRLVVRRRRPGDRFQPLGMRSPKKLQDFFVDAHLPRSARNAVPLVCVGERILWVVGCRIAEWARVTGSTGRVLRLEAVRSEHEA